METKNKWKKIESLECMELIISLQTPIVHVLNN
jgi:hypothetical protein